MHNISSHLYKNLSSLLRSVVLPCLTCGYLLASPALAQSSFDKGKKWYQKRAVKADSFQARSRYINNAIHAFKDTYHEEGPSEETAIYLLKSFYFKGMYTDLEEDLQKKVFNRARDFGELAVEDFPNSTPIKFWYAANIGRWASLHGVVASATSGVAGKLRELSGEVIKQAPSYQDGGGYRLLSQVHFHAPNIPLVMGWPSDNRALELIQQAVGIAPDNPNNRLFYAEILLEFNEYQQAEMHLHYLAEELEPRATHLVEDRYIKHRARKLLEDQ